MTPEAQRIAIAEACSSVCYLDEENEWRLRGSFNRRFDPLNDLNAIHAVERTLTPLLWRDYLQNLINVSVGLTGNIFFCYTATAAQRAEAVLRTIERWKEEQNA